MPNSVKICIAQHHQVVTSEALGPGSMLASNRNKKKPEKKKRNVFSLDLKTATESLSRTVFGSQFKTAIADQ